MDGWMDITINKAYKLHYSALDYMPISTRHIIEMFKIKKVNSFQKYVNYICYLIQACKT